ncbi:MAG TPA: hypothetical protein VIM42_10315 [Clostridium sp.]
MTVTNLAISQQINLATVLNTKLESPILQTEMGLNVLATATKQAVRWDEFSAKFNNNGTFKGIIQADMLLDVLATLTKQAIRWDEFTIRHNNNGTIKPMNYNKSTVSNPSATANTLGTAVILLPATNFTGIYPEAIDFVFGGTFGSETVTAQITATYSDLTTGIVTKTATAVGTTSFSNSDLMALIKDGVFITQASFQSKSTIASSLATVTFNRCGIYL